MVETEVLGAARGKDADVPAPDLSVVVTLFNEADTLPDLYRRTVQVLEWLRVLLVMIFL
jgi:hypothetical protein